MVGALWKVLIVPAAVVGVVSSFQIDVDEFFMMPAGAFAVVGAGITGALDGVGVAIEVIFAAVGGFLKPACRFGVAFDTIGPLGWPWVRIV